MAKTPENHVRMFDTTLRDGEQSPGASMTSAEKLEVARQLAVLGSRRSRPGSRVTATIQHSSAIASRA